MKNKPLEPIKFNFYKLDILPLKENGDLRAKDLLDKIISVCSPNKNGNKGYLIDRFESRIGVDRRELFINYITYNHLQKRYKGSICLLRRGKTPMVKPLESYSLIPLESLNLGSLAETTHFFIDVSSTKIILCFEYNYYGPRISDLEYYFRNIGKDNLGITKKTSITFFLDRPFEEVLDNIKELNSFDIKIEPKKIAQIEKKIVNSYFTSLNSIGSLFSPKYLSFKAYYQTPGASIRTDSSKAKSMVEKLIKSFRSGHTDLESFDSFTIEFINQNDEPDKLNLIKNQKSFTIEVNMDEIRSHNDWYILIENEFNKFIEQQNG
ncbi:hypothetical protein [Sphingobacterium anhuiense]|uniref:Uncharacterized protein n=1 Tax=Sphingobacterium anhuiense TaxID=493780 RepID=A0ABW5YQJ0_9SPHI